MRQDRNPSRLASSSVRFHVSARTPGWLAKLVAFAVGLVLLVVGLAFSVLVLAFVLSAALPSLGFLWWKTRGLRKQMREGPQDGRVIEGEVIVNDADEDAIRRR